MGLDLISTRSCHGLLKYPTHIMYEIQPIEIRSAQQYLNTLMMSLWPNEIAINISRGSLAQNFTRAYLCLIPITGTDGTEFVMYKTCW